MPVNQRGQALIEMAVFVFATIGLVACLLGFTQWFTTRQNLLITAREGALLYSSGHFSQDEVKTKMREYLATVSPAIDPSRAALTVGPHPELPYRLFQLDYVAVRYPLTSHWLVAIGLDGTLEESCTIKHAPQFGLQWQPLYGPPVSWYGNDPI